MLEDAGPREPKRIVVAGDPDALCRLPSEAWLAGGAFPRAPEVFPQAYSIRAKVRALYPSAVYLE